MKEHTDEEIREFLQQVFTGNLDNYSGADTIDITRNPDNIELRIAAEYRAPKLRFEDINRLAEFFDTMNVETNSEFGSSGCDTCDYGSEYGYYLYVSPGQPYSNVGQEDDNGEG